MIGRRSIDSAVALLLLGKLTVALGKGMNLIEFPMGEEDVIFVCPIATGGLFRKDDNGKNHSFPSRIRPRHFSLNFEIC